MSLPVRAGADHFVPRFPAGAFPLVGIGILFIHCICMAGEADGRMQIS